MAILTTKGKLVSLNWKVKETENFVLKTSLTVQPTIKNKGSYTIILTVILDFSQVLTTPLCLGFSLTHHLPFLSIDCPKLSGPFLLPLC